MKKTKGNTVASLQLGKMISAHMRANRITHAVAARRLNRNQTTLKRILKNESIQTYLVWELSVALGHNFFTDLAQQLDATTEGKLQAQQTELEQLKTNFQKLQEDYNLLKKMVDMLGER